MSNNGSSFQRWIVIFTATFDIDNTQEVVRKRKKFSFPKNND